MRHHLNELPAGDRGVEPKDLERRFGDDRLELWSANRRAEIRDGERHDPFV